MMESNMAQDQVVEENLENMEDDEVCGTLNKCFKVS